MSESEDTVSIGTFTCPDCGFTHKITFTLDEAREHGLSRRPHFTGPDDFVFGTVRGTMQDEKSMRDGLYDAMEQAEISRDRGTGKPFVFHDLRHTFGTQAVQAFPLSDVKAYMGHSDIATTMLYVHHVPQHDAADRLGRLVSAASGVELADRPLSRHE